MGCFFIKVRFNKFPLDILCVFILDKYMNYNYNTTQTYNPQSVDPAVAAAAAGFSMTFMLIALVFIVVVVVAIWKVFVKAGKPGWAAIIPIYNIWVLLEVVKRPGWWLLLFFVPFVNIVINIIIGIDLAKVFGKDAIFGFFLNVLLAPIGQLILGFGSAKYTGKR